MPIVRVNGRNLAYEVKGSDTPILFIHGFGGNLLAWGPLIGKLSGSFRCIAYDQRDSGNSDRAAEPYAIRDMADDAAGLITALGIAPCHVVGYSMGGAVAQELAINFPSLLRGLALIATYTSGDRRGSDNLRSWAKIRAAFDRETYFRTIYPWLYTYREYEWPGFIEQSLRLAVEAPNPQEQDAYERQMEATLAHDAVDRLHLIAAPTLVLVGADDILAPLRFSRVLATEIPDARLMVLPEVGHGLLRVKTDDVSRALAGFWRSLDEDNQGNRYADEVADDVAARSLPERNG